MTPEQIQSLKDVVLAAEILLSAMDESEKHGANYDLIKHPVQHLTSYLLECYRTGALKDEALPK